MDAIRCGKPLFLWGVDRPRDRRAHSPRDVFRARLVVEGTSYGEFAGAIMWTGNLVGHQPSCLHNQGSGKGNVEKQLNEWTRVLAEHISSWSRSPAYLMKEKAKGRIVRNGHLAI
jgi:hypothetical protein